MVFSINPDNLENNDFRLVDDDGDLELLHKPSGATFTYDAGESAWIPSAGFGTDANPVTGTSHFDAVNTERSIIGDNLVTEELETFSLTGPFDETYNLDQFDLFEVRYFAGGSGATSELQLQIGGETADGNESYDYQSLSGGTITETTGADQFQILTASTRPAQGLITVPGRRGPAPSGSGDMGIWHEGQVRTGQNQLITGSGPSVTNHSEITLINPDGDLDIEGSIIGVNVV